jgi:hypothetical protein
MKLIFRSYLASLRERDELDAILPDLLSELGYNVYSRPQRGTGQAGVDIAAVGPDEDGERKLFLFAVKRGDITRESWNDGTPQSLRASLDTILDNYLQHRVPKRYQSLKVVVCIVFGGDMQEQVRSDVEGYTRRNSSDRISFEEWNGDKLAGLLMRGVLREEIMPKALRIRFQKAVAMVDEPEIAYEHFALLVQELCQSAANDKERVRTARQIYIALWVLFVWARDVDNVEAPYRASELVLLRIWDLLRRYIGKTRNAAGKAITAVLQYTIQLHLTIAEEILHRKVLSHAGVPHGVSMAIRASTPADVNLKLFDILGRIAMTGIWVQWIHQQLPGAERRAKLQAQVAALADAGFKLIRANPALFLPLQDGQSIEIALFLLLVGAASGNMYDAHAWLRGMTQRLALTVRAHGRYPCIFSEYRDLIAHPRERTEEYRQEATAGSTLIPLMAAFLSYLGDHESLAHLVALKNKELQQCTLQLWIPDESSEDGLYVGDDEHGIALCDLPLTANGKELVETLDAAFKQVSSFEKLSAISSGYWPIVLAACHHYRLPVPPQFWRPIVAPPVTE